MIPRICFGAALLLLSACSLNRVYVNPAKTSSQAGQDEQKCRAEVASDAPELRQKSFDACMVKLGYKAMSESAAKKVRGFSKSWVNTEVDFKAYQAAFIEPVDTSMAALKDPGMPDLFDNKLKAAPEEAAELAVRMRKAFTEALGGILKVETDRAALAGKKAVVVKLALDKILGADPGANIASNIFIGTSVTSAQLTMRCELDDAATGEPLVTLADTHASSQIDDNTTFLGTESFDRWLGAFKTVELWADRLAALLDAKRGVPHKSPFKKQIF